MLLIVIRMEFHAKRNFARRETMHHITGFGVPQFDVTIVAGRHELRTFVVETNVLDSLPMTNICANATPFTVNLPQFHATVHTARQKQMRRLRYETDCRNALRMTGPGVNVSFWQETLVWRCVRSQINANIVRSMQERSSLVVQWILDCKKKLPI